MTQSQANDAAAPPEQPQFSEYALGYIAGYRQALAALHRANRANVSTETALSKLNQHQFRLIQWRNSATNGDTPPKLNLWK